MDSLASTAFVVFVVIACITAIVALGSALYAVVRDIHKHTDLW